MHICTFQFSIYVQTADGHKQQKHTTGFHPLGGRLPDVGGKLRGTVAVRAAMGEETAAHLGRTQEWCLTLRDQPVWPLSNDGW